MKHFNQSFLSVIAGLAVACFSTFNVATVQAQVTLESTEDLNSASTDQPASDFNPVPNEIRIQGIRNRIDLLKDILARQKADAEAAREAIRKEMSLPTLPDNANDLRSATNVGMSSDTKSGKATDSTAADPITNVNTTVQREPAAEPANTAPNTEVQNEPDALDEQPLPSSQNASQQPDAGMPAIATPINSMELANSLFATGNYAQALRSYEALLAASKAADAATMQLTASDIEWLKCFSANCYRITGATSTAETLYREVAASKENIYAADYSRWALDHRNHRERIESAMEILNSELTSLTANKNSN